MRKTYRKKYSVKKRKNKTKKYGRKGGMPPKKQKELPHQPITMTYDDILAKLNWAAIAQNPGAMPLIKENMDKIDINELAKNPNPEAVAIVATRLNELQHWRDISKNPSAIGILKNNIGKVSWQSIFSNPNPEVLDMVRQNFHTIEEEPNTISVMNGTFVKQPYAAEFFINEHPFPGLADLLAFNTSPAAMAYIEQHINELPKGVWAWRELSANPSACAILENNRDKIFYEHLASNPNCLHLLPENLKNMDGIFWANIAKNPQPEAINIFLSGYPSFNFWKYFAQNPNPEVIEIFRKNLARAYEQTSYLSENPNAIKLLGDYFANEIKWKQASSNPRIMDLINEIGYQSRKPLIKMVEGNKEPKNKKQVGLPPILSNPDWHKDLTTYL